MNTDNNKMTPYRPEIDGLRAIAIIAVMFFHADFKLFPGGFVGVDVFFVISGYLITSIIAREMEDDNFSILRFYERRAKRILPALFFVILCCLPLAWMWMLPGELTRFAHSLAAVAFFSSNLYFWRTTDYFAPAAEDQPLLHMWSLAVEEQYYVVFPLIILASWRLGKARLFRLLVCMLIVSLALSEWGWRNKPAANFFLLPFRAWEILAGSLLALLPLEPASKLRNNETYSNTGSMVGLFLILFSVVYLDKNTPFPSLYTTIPVVGAALVILFAKPTNWVGSLLASKPFVAIGLISYSAYLWHQPLLVIARKAYSNSVYGNILLTIAALAVTLLLAWLTYRYVETYFRINTFRRPLIKSSFALAMLAVISIPLSLFTAAHYRPLGKLIEVNSRAKDYQKWADGNYPTSTCFNKKVFDGYYSCEFGNLQAAKIGLVLWGDSLAEALSYGLHHNLQGDGLKGIAYIAIGCPPILDLSRPIQKGCHNDVHRSILKSVLMQNDAHNVILLGNVAGGSHNKDCIIDGSPTSWPVAKKKIKTIQNQLEAAGKKLFFVEQGPKFPREVAAFYLTKEILGRREDLVISKSSHLMTIAEQRELKAYGIRYIQTADFFCQQTSCHASKNGELMFYDKEHYTFYGSRLFANFILGEITDTVSMVR
ncbi:acyltransferase family protein [Noviherbaspirillum malthae]|uniref:acyltransferase family protein n=1 Tax=Noviherbaspirillum malthae TaxID=1260987 RepID=UPI001E2B55A9|nr:acyltransferase family protein [Noviherbaspirillum malthae]